MHVVIDADQLVYACGFAAEGEPISHVLGNVKTALDKIIKATGATSWTIYISGDYNFRDQLATTQVYKGNRSARKPKDYESIREYLILRGAVLAHGFEADDMVSVELYEDFIANDGDPDKCEVIVSSPDKDLNNTPGWHYNPQKDEVFWVTENQAMRHFCYQMLAGDNTDNIKGLPYCTRETIVKYNLPRQAEKGCGKASAKKVLEGTETWQDAMRDVMDCYIAWGRAERKDPLDIFAYMHEQMALLWMIRERDPYTGELRIFEMTKEMWEIYDERIRKSGSSEPFPDSQREEGEGGRGETETEEGVRAGDEGATGESTEGSLGSNL